MTTKQNKKRRTNTKKKQPQTEVTKELIIWITLILSILLLLCVFQLCGPLNNVFGAFLFGCFGFLAYLFPFVLFFTVGFYYMNKENKRVVHRIFGCWVLYLLICGIIHMFYTSSIKTVWDSYTFGLKTHGGGGFFGGCISLGLTAIMGTLATFLMLFIFAIMLLVFITGKFIATMFVEESAKKYQEISEEKRIHREAVQKERKEQQKNKRTTYTFPKEKTVKNVERPTPVLDENKVEDSLEVKNNLETETTTNEMKIHRGIEEVPIYEKEIEEKFGKNVERSDHSLDKLIERAMEEHVIEDNIEVETITEEELIQEESTQEESFLDVPIMEDDCIIESPIQESVTIDAPIILSNEAVPSSSESKSFEENTVLTKSLERKEPQEEVEVKIELPPEPIPYIFPSIDLLSKPNKSTAGMSDTALKDTAQKLQDCLKSFKVQVTMTDIICGPTVTRYELQPALGTRVKKITELENDIKLNLAAADIRIEAPIPGKSAVGIEVPNSSNVTISLREMLETKEFKVHKSKVAVAVGKDISGRNIVTDIAKMPHMLIAGSTGSGKSVCINTIVMSIIYKADPNDVKLIMIDPKVVELSVYNGIPHLCIPVVTDPKKAAAALNWAVVEMNDRYSKFAEFGVRDMVGFNKKVEQLRENPNLYTKMPQIVIIVDELADLMMVASNDVETAICRLAQMARAAGIHLIIATQRPSVDVITGLIKANVPSRIAFAVSSAIDSRTIIDGAGAEKLLGKGDMLFFPQGLSKPVRVQGAFVSDSEVARVTDFIKNQYDEPVYDNGIHEKITSGEFMSGSSNQMFGDSSNDDSNGRDEKFEEAARFVIEKQKASIGTLQRVFKIGFNRGARIMDQLSEAGIVSEEDGKKPRNILMTLEEFEQMLQEGR